MRHFTRTQVEQVFLEHWGKAFQDDGYEIAVVDVFWIPEVKPPIYVVEYRVKREGHVLDGTVLLYEHKHVSPVDQHRYFALYAPTTIKLPEGAKDVPTENKLLKQTGELL